MDLMSTLLMFGLMFGVMYFMLIRPENKRKKEEAEMRAAIKVGDEVSTIGGILGKVVHVKEDRVVIETSADQVRIEMLKASISTNETAAARAKEEAKRKQEERAKALAARKASKK